MEHLPEFISNHIFLCGGLVVVLVMLVKVELDQQTSKAFQLNSVNAIRMMNDDKTLVLDVRESADYGKGHIKNARNIPLSSLKDSMKDIMKYKDDPVLTYCASGTISGQACKELKKSGFTNIHNIAGGLNSWLEAKLPLTKKS